MMRLVRTALGACLLSAFTSQRAVAQNPPSPAQAQGALQQALKQNPGLADVIRQRIQQSGLTPDQIRARLQASGYPANLLDAYFGAAVPGQAAVAPSVTELAAIQALGLQPISLAVSALPVDTGLVRTMRSEPTSPVFGVDVFRRTTTQ